MSALDEHVEEDELSGLVDGEVAPARAAEVRGHLEGCAPCAEVYDELARLRAAARDLAPPLPPVGMFEKVMAEALPAEVRPLRAVTQPAPARRRPTRWLAGGIAAAALAAAGVFAIAALRAREPRPPVASVAPSPTAAVEPDLMAAAVEELARGEAHYTRAIGELKKIAIQERTRWTPEVAQSFDQSLREIDQAVERTRDVARRAPGDPDSQDALVRAYRREVNFLEEMIVRGSLAPQGGSTP